MADVRPFPCLLPQKELASRVAALPYDVYNRAEAKAEALRDPISFLNIDRPESNLPDDADMYGAAAYAKARELFDARLADGTYISEETPAYYVYELIMDGRSQKGIVGCSSVGDYENGVIKKHENVLPKKAQDRVRHIEALEAQTGPIFLAYHRDAFLSGIITETMKTPPIFAFTAEDGITHNGWQIADAATVAQVQDAFAEIPCTYIADGHHRTESAAEVGRKQRAANPNHTGEESYNFFLSVLFADDELEILPYNRVVRDLNRLSKEEFLAKVGEVFAVEEVAEAYQPVTKGNFGMFLDGQWYRLKATQGDSPFVSHTKGLSPCVPAADPIASLDVSVLQDKLLTPILGIGDPRTDERIEFIGGIRGLAELERRVQTDMAVAFSMHATSIAELFAVADAGLLMPPKSTWFEPKLRSGLFIHRI